jgi:D-alanyl-D-alanine carboxypeptidase/D-alanyl-D-alanine-endopeptidase (penicillin-binding protein 4)
MAKFEELNVQSMRRVFFVISYSLIVIGSSAQTISQKLQKAFATFEKDSQLKHAISSLYVIDANTGQVVFDKNSQIGLAPASTQKIITSVTAFELLGKGFRYKTYFVPYRSSVINNGINLQVVGSGDPTFGSWRYDKNFEKNLFDSLFQNFKRKGISKIRYLNVTSFFQEEQIIPDGWINQDIGNYYGAGAAGLNWRENQYDLVLIPGKQMGERVVVDSVIPSLGNPSFANYVKTGAKGSGDNAYIYFFGKSSYEFRGTVPLGPDRFVISGAIKYPDEVFARSLMEFLDSKGLRDSLAISQDNLFSTGTIPIIPDDKNIIYIHYSPSLDSIIYWFNKKSINLYGEALIKTFAYEKSGFASTDSGVAVAKNFWKEKGLDKDELNIVDGSGLSPLNRVTTHSQVEILKYAKTKDWFPYFYTSLPEYNKMSMKSGTIRGVKGFCGYHKAKNGKEYIFSFLVNNYNGSSSSLVNKMYKVLDILK